MPGHQQTAGSQPIAVIYVPTSITEPHAFAAVVAPCLERIEACGYQFHSIVRTWPVASDMARRGLVDIILVVDKRLLPPDRLPRIESVDEPVPQPAPVAEPSTHRRRPRMTR